MPYTSAQQLNRRITIERKAGGQDDLGQPLDNWQTYCKLWAKINVPSAGAFVNNEFNPAGHEVSRITATITVRKRDGITAGMRVLHQGEVFEIRVVLPDLVDNRYIVLGVAKGANDG